MVRERARINMHINTYKYIGIQCIVFCVLHSLEQWEYVGRVTTSLGFDVFFACVEEVIIFIIIKIVIIIVNHSIIFIQHSSHI